MYWQELDDLQNSDDSLEPAIRAVDAVLRDADKEAVLIPSIIADIHNVPVTQVIAVLDHLLQSKKVICSIEILCAELDGQLLTEAELQSENCELCGGIEAPPGCSETRVYRLSSLAKGSLPHNISIATPVQNFHQIYSSADQTPRTTVLLFHGLDSDWQQAWTTRKGVFWPSWLGEDRPNADVFSVGMQMRRSDWQGGSMPLFDRAKNVVAGISNLPRIGDRIVLIGHSMGGLVIKQVVQEMNSQKSSSLDKISHCVFIGTPHHGSGYASAAKYLPRFLRPSHAVTELVASNSSLRQLNDWFKNWVSDQRVVSTTSFYETRPKPLLWKLRVGPLIVTETSADLGLVGHHPIALEGDHVEISKCNSKSDLLYREICRLLA